jgi:hypothetical protein
MADMQLTLKLRLVLTKKDYKFDQY